MAIADYTKVIELDETNAAAYSNRAYTYRQTGAFAKALADLERALALDPDDDDVKNDIAELKKKCGNG